MKKIFLLLATSLIFFAGCKKEVPQEVTDGYVVKKDVICECGAKYFVTCKDPFGNAAAAAVLGRFDWITRYTPTNVWEVTNEAGDYVPFEEHFSQTKMKFKCQNQDCKGTMGEFKIEDFKPQIPDVPPITN